MLDNYSINKLFELPDDFFVQETISNDNTVIHITIRRQPQICPACGKETSLVHDYREQVVADISHLGKPFHMIFRKRRYVCSCGKRFYEKNSMLSRYQRQTDRLRMHILAAFTDMKSTTQIAEDNFVSSGIASRIFRQLHYPKPSSLPSVIAIDEFRGNVQEKFQCILADPMKHEVLDIISSRDSEELHAWFNQYPLKERKKVRYIVMDLSPLFRSVMKSCFPKAKIIADKFHTVRMITQALDKVRKDVQKQFGRHRRISFKRSKSILLKQQYLLSDEEKDRLAIMLQASDRLRQAYSLKELFYDVMDSRTRSEFRARLGWFIYEVEDAEMPEFQRHVETLRNWAKEIELAVLTGCSNGYVEGCNNRTKVLKRICYGFRNFRVFRNRILYIANNTKLKRKNRCKTR